MIFSPVLSQMLKGRLGQDGVAIFAALALTYSYHHPFAVDIGYLKTRCFAGPQSRRIRDHQNYLVLEIRGDGKEGFHLGQIQNDRKFPFGSGIPDLLHRPFAFQRRSV